MTKTERFLNSISKIGGPAGAFIIYGAVCLCGIFITATASNERAKIDALASVWLERAPEVARLDGGLNFLENDIDAGMSYGRTMLELAKIEAIMDAAISGDKEAMLGYGRSVEAIKSRPNRWMSEAGGRLDAKYETLRKKGLAGKPVSQRLAPRGRSGRFA